MLINDQDGISPYNIKPISRRQVIGIKMSIWGLKVDPIQNSPNSHHNNCMASSKENYW